VTTNKPLIGDGWTCFKKALAFILINLTEASPNFTRWSKIQTWNLRSGESNLINRLSRGTKYPELKNDPMIRWIYESGILLKKRRWAVKSQLPWFQKIWYSFRSREMMDCGLRRWGPRGDYLIWKRLEDFCDFGQIEVMRLPNQACLKAGDSGSSWVYLQKEYVQKRFGLPIHFGRRK